MVCFSAVVVSWHRFWRDSSTMDRDGSGSWLSSHYLPVRVRAYRRQYWCAILCAAGFLFLFFFMEETNYHRELSPRQKTEGKSSAGPPQAIAPIPNEMIQEHKSYWSRLKVFDTRALRYPNHLKGMVLRPLIFFTFPVIFYSGFSYGSNLIWFNVLNGTASLILSENPYGFSSSIVGLCYFSPLIGVIIG